MIQRLKEEDSEELFALTIANSHYLREWLPWLDNINTVADTDEFITNATKAFDAGTGITYTIRLNDQPNKIVGICGFNKIDFDKKIGYIGYWLGEEFQGHGLVSQACRELEKVAFNGLKLHILDIRAAVENHKSRAVAKRLGYTEVRTITDAEWLYVHHVNHVVYEKTNDSI